jgi:hypothetical protein
MSVVRGEREETKRVYVKKEMRSLQKILQGGNSK